MDIENRLITTEDQGLLCRYRDDQGLTEKYKHPCGTWSNDCLLYTSPSPRDS
mgnify:CR=1 FL=1